MSKINVKIESELAGLDFTKSGFHLIALNGGAVNSSYRLETSCKNYFIKIFESDKIALLDREKLFNIQLELAEKGLAVKPVYLSKFSYFQIDEWLDIPTLGQSEVSNLTVTKSLALALSIIHNTKIDAPKLDLPLQWKHYASLIGLSVSEQHLIESYTGIWYNACSTKSVFCHNDLSIFHVTIAKPIIVFDWEYSAVSCPYFDLASCVAVNGFDLSDEASLYSFYAQYTEQRLSEVTAKVTTMKPLVELTNRLWYQAATLSIAH